MASLYLHIPFCERKCIYCDFYSIESLTHVEPFLQALHAEIRSVASRGYAATYDTIFLGGGTPSLLTPDQLAGILDLLHSSFAIDPGAEVTVETNPGTVSLEKLAAYRKLGVNRLSVGVQSFDDRELNFLSRIHNSMQALTCVAQAKEGGFENISLDLIYALPGQTLTAWEKNLKQAIALEPKHISAYGLIVEDHTPLSKMVEQKLVSPAPVEVEARYFEFAMEFLASYGYEHYEVSNYCLPGFRSRHNYSYWAHTNYLGFGPSAHSFWKDDRGATRWSNVANLSTYCSQIILGKTPVAMEEIVSSQSLINERIFLGLRSDGLDTRKLEADFGVMLDDQRQDIMQELVKGGKASWVEGRFRLTPQGFLICDEIAERLIL